MLDNDALLHLLSRPQQGVESESPNSVIAISPETSNLNKENEQQLSVPAEQEDQATHVLDCASSPNRNTEQPNVLNGDFMSAWYGNSCYDAVDTTRTNFGDFMSENIDVFNEGILLSNSSTPNILHGRTHLRPSGTVVSDGPADTARLTAQDNGYSLNISSSTAKELYVFIHIQAHRKQCSNRYNRIDIFFEKIQGFLPLFHRPLFYANYVEQKLSDERCDRLSLETALLLNSVFALAARFCDNLEVPNTELQCRGDSFAEQARFLYERARRGRGSDRPTFEYLQGCVVFTYYLFLSNPCTFAWVILGVCCRLAYDMGLHETDRKAIYDDIQNEDPEDWVEQEGRRRLWWSLWELDSYASRVSCRPCNIDQNRVFVLLPVSDEAWFANKRIASAPLGTDITTVWQSLEDCENQDERGWYLVSQALLKYADEAVQSRHVPPRRSNELQEAITGLGLLLPPKFHITLGSILFDRSNFSKSNWIVGTNLTLQE